MAEWRVVRSLLTLRDQINALAPGRSKASDGTVGDAAHQAGTSDHNPARYSALGSTPVVCALDVTQDPAHGADMGPIAEALRLSRDRRIGYVIFNRRITGPNHGWAWDRYSGSDPHTNHMHVSTVHTAAADDTSPWRISSAPAASSRKGTEVNIIGVIGDNARYAVGPAGLVLIGWDEWVASGWEANPPPVLLVKAEKLAAFQAAGAVTVDMTALAAALNDKLTAASHEDIVAALESVEGQAALVKADAAAVRAVLGAVDGSSPAA